MKTRVELACFAMLCVLLAAVIVQGAKHCHKDGGCEDENKKTEEPLRLIMVGKTGSGKSATGNTILGEKKFEVGRMSKSVTQKAQLERTVIDGRTVEVQDRPSLSSTTLTDEEVAEEISHPSEAVSPGPLVFLYVIKPDRYTEEDLDLYQRVKKLMVITDGHMVVVFTHLIGLEADGLTPDDFIDNLDADLRDVLNDCGRRHVFFNNRSPQNRSQVDSLMTVIRKLGETRQKAEADTGYRYEAHELSGSADASEVGERKPTPSPTPTPTPGPFGGPSSSSNPQPKAAAATATANATSNERTLVVVKPDGVERQLIGEVLQRFERRGLRLVGAKLCKPDPVLLRQLYEGLAHQPFFGSLMEFMTSGPVLATVWEGTEVVKMARAMLGTTDPAFSPPGTIRGDLGTDVERNVCHASDTVDAARREIALWFNPEELVAASVE